jgi:hypothetical protein
MKTVISGLVLAVALVFTGPTFAGDVTKATDKVATRLAACGTTALRNALRKCNPGIAVSCERALASAGALFAMLAVATDCRMFITPRNRS